MDYHVQKYAWLMELLSMVICLPIPKKFSIDSVDSAFYVAFQLDMLCF